MLLLLWHCEVCGACRCNPFIPEKKSNGPFVLSSVAIISHRLLPIDKAASLDKLGTFAGNDAIVAFARAHPADVIVHQLSQPRWFVASRGAGEVGDAAHGPVPVVHVAYFDWEHCGFVAVAW